MAGHWSAAVHRVVAEGRWALSAFQLDTSSSFLGVVHDDSRVVTGLHRARQMVGRQAGGVKFSARPTQGNAGQPYHSHSRRRCGRALSPAAAAVA